MARDEEHKRPLSEVRQARVVKALGKWPQVEGGEVLAPGEWRFVREAEASEEE